MINSLYIKNYRIFKELHINKFAKVNLIIGKNNVGKTSLLEAIMLLVSNKNMIYNIFQILSHRKEFLDTNLKTQKLLEILTTLFHNQNVSNESIFISVNEQQAYSIYLTDQAPTLIIKQADKIIEKILLSEIPQRLDSVTNNDTNIAFVKANIPESSESLSQTWGKIALSDKEEYIIDAIKIIDDKIERFAFIDDAIHLKKAIVKLRDTKQPVSLNSMGDGINQILRTILALVRCENGYLLIDEFATGLHWSVQMAFWKMIFQLSQKLNIQIFATTHSLDTLTAFQEIAKSENYNSEAAVIKLQSKKNKIKAIHFKVQDIMIAVEQNIEVR